MIEVVRGFLYPKYIVRTSSGYTRIGTSCSFRLWCDNRKNENFKVYVRMWSVNLFLKGSSENEQMRVCLTGKIGGIFCISLLCPREKELSAVSIGANSYIFKKRLGLSKVEETSCI